MKGTFECIIVNHILAESGKKGTPSVKFTLEPQFNVVTKAQVENPKNLYWDGWLTNEAFDNTMKTLSNCVRWNGDNLSDLNGTYTFCGMKVWAVVEEETYNGKTSDKVKFMNPVGGGAGSVEPLDAVKAKSLSESLKGRVLNFRQTNLPVNNGPAEDIKL